MAINTEQTITITCDNPDCPGIPEYLKPNDQFGWLTVSCQRYGSAALPTKVYCCENCAKTYDFTG